MTSEFNRRAFVNTSLLAAVAALAAGAGLIVPGVSGAASGTGAGEACCCCPCDTACRGSDRPVCCGGGCCTDKCCAATTCKPPADNAGVACKPDACGIGKTCCAR